MLIRENGDGRWLVSQPAHAWVAAQLAMAWGNDLFPPPTPREDVILGTMLHDIGWLRWEAQPTFNPQTGLPHTFMELPTSTHLDIWEPATQLALPFGRYAALLVSLHGTYLYGFHDYERDTPDEAARARAFVANEKTVQRELISSLAADAVTGAAATDEAIERNRRLLALWDGLSLAICGGVQTPRTFKASTAAGAEATLQLSTGGDTLTVDPWPFSTESLLLRVDARPCGRNFRDHAELHDWLADAHVESIEIRLVQERN